MAIRVLVNGANGRMGSETVRAVEADAELELAGTADVEDSLADAIASSGAEVVVDFTVPQAAAANTEAILRAGARPVVGTTGFRGDQIAALQALAAELKLGGLIAPNFAIGAVLMMMFSEQAARYLPHVEIIELHHDKKLDAPSGTASRTAELIAAARRSSPAPAAVGEHQAPGARGADIAGIRVHSVRLPGLVAHQSVLFGGKADTLTIRHDSFDRSSFMPGVCLACRKAPELDGLLVGLEHLLQ